MIDVNGASTCGASKRDGTPCGQRAGHGTSHLGHGRCSTHGGSTPTHVVSAVRAVVERSGVLQAGGFLTFTDPVEALSVLAQDVARTHGLIGWLTSRIEARGTELAFQVEAATDDGIVLVEGTSHMWKALYAEREHLVRAVRALSACQLELPFAERVGSISARIVEDVLDALAVTPQQRDRAHDVALDSYRRLTETTGTE